MKLNLIGHSVAFRKKLKIDKIDLKKNTERLQENCFHITLISDSIFKIFLEFICKKKKKLMLTFYDNSTFVNINQCSNYHLLIVN